jgi:hypothetical protein
MVEKVMSAGVQASSMRGVQASPSIACGYGPSQEVTKKLTKHHDDLENVNLIPYILSDYISPLAGTVSRDSVRRDFDYTLITTYLSKGIRTVGP